VTPQEVGQIVLRILGSWAAQSAKVDSHAMTIAYGEGLLDLEYRTTLSVVQELAKTEVYLPTIATIRARVVARNHGERRRGIDAWGDVVAEVRKCGLQGRPTFSDALVGSAVATIGWSAICNAKETDSSVRSKFCELYDELAGSEYRQAAVSSGAMSRSLPPRSERAGLVGDLVRGLLDNKTEEDNDDDNDE